MLLYEHTSGDKKTLKLVSLTTTFAQLLFTTNAPIVLDVSKYKH